MTTKQHLQRVIDDLRAKAAEEDAKVRMAQTAAQSYREAADVAERQLYRSEREAEANSLRDVAPPQT